MLILKVFLVVISFVSAYLTWRFIEKPARNSKVISGKSIFILAILLSTFFVFFGYYLNKSYGMAYRVFDSNIEIKDMDKRTYNEKVFVLKKNNFTYPRNLKILVVGNSFGRDFVNMTQETFDMHNINIVYRDDLPECIFPYKNTVSRNLYGSADVIVFASGEYNKDCIKDNIYFSESHNKSLFYIGIKHFGYNLNWIIRLHKENVPNQFNPLLSETIDLDLDMSSSIPRENYISLLSPLIKDGQIPVTDDSGRMLSMDRAHLTKYGALFFGKNVLLKSNYGDLLINKIN